MRKLIALAFSALIATPALAEETAPFGPLVAPQELAAVQVEVKLHIIDIRAEDVFEEGHIAGSVSAPYGLFRGPKSNPGQLVPEAQLQETYRTLGLTKDRPVVIVFQGKDQTDFGAAARVYWTLKSSGLKPLTILDGGIESWTAAGLPLTSGKVAPVPSEIEITFSDEWLATTDDVVAASGGQSSAQLVDARPAAFWKGEKAHPAAANAGTVPGSSYTAHSTWFDGAPTTLAPKERVAALASQAGIGGEGRAVISFCNTGHWAATSWFALSEVAGVPGVKLYAESMVGYTGAGLPVQAE